MAGIFLRFLISMVSSAFIGAGHLSAVDSVKETMLADSYFEAGDYGRAHAEYESLYDDILPKWQKDMLLYAIGTTLLAEGKWEEALNKFQQVSDDAAELPYLNQQLSSNSALAYLMMAKVQMETVLADPNATNDDYSRAMTLFRQAQLEIDRATNSWCDLASVEGATSCPPALKLDEMRLEAKQQYAALLNNYLEFRLQHASAEEGVAALLSAETAIIGHLDTLHLGQFDEALKTKYLAYYFKQANSWEVLWEAIGRKIEEGREKPKYKEQIELFEFSKSKHEQGLALMEKGSFLDSKQNIQGSYKSLDDLLSMVVAANPVDAALQRLLVIYGLALAKDPLQEVPLESVIEAQDALGEKLLTADEKIKSDFRQAQEYLKLSFSALQKFQPVKARVLGEAARFFIKSIAAKIGVASKDLAEGILENAIDKEEFALLINRLWKQVEDQASGLSEVQGLLPTVQRSALDTADAFVAAALLRQKERFRGQGPNRCQCHPWDEVIPLFSAGYSRAKRVDELLQKPTGRMVEGNAVVPLLAEAVKDWKEALEKLRAAASKTTKDSESQPNKDDNQQPSGGETGAESLNDVLRLVQEMENDDRSGPSIQVAGEKGDERPW